MRIGRPVVRTVVVVLGTLSCAFVSVAENQLTTDDAIGPAKLDDVLPQFDGRTQVSIAGQVLDERQRPVPGASVTVFGPDGALNTESDGDGSYRFRGDALGLYAIVAESPEYVVTASTRMEWKWEGVTSIVTERVTIEGVVVDSDTGRPLAEFECAEVWDTALYRLGGMPDRDSRPATRVDDAKGRFTIPIYRPRLPAVVFRAPGYQPYLVRFANDQIGAHIGGMVVPLVRSVVIHGTVVDGNGKPILGAQIVVGALVPAGASPEDHAVTQTGPDGSFQVEAAPDETPSIAAYHPDYAPGVATIERESAGALTARIVLTPGGRIEGTVTRDGAPAANVLVLLKCEGFTWQSTHTDEAGHYAFANVPAGGSEVLVEDRRLNVRVVDEQTAAEDFELGEGK